MVREVLIFVLSENNDSIREAQMFFGHWYTLFQIISEWIFTNEAGNRKHNVTLCYLCCNSISGEQPLCWTFSHRETITKHWVGRVFFFRWERLQKTYFLEQRVLNSSLGSALSRIKAAVACVCWKLQMLICLCSWAPPVIVLAMTGGLKYFQNCTHFDKPDIFGKSF